MLLLALSWVEKAPIITLAVALDPEASVPSTGSGVVASHTYEVRAPCD